MTVPCCTNCITLYILKSPSYNQNNILDRNGGPIYFVIAAIAVMLYVYGETARGRDSKSKIKFFIEA